MAVDSNTPGTAPVTTIRRRAIKSLIYSVLAAALGWLVIAYLILPVAWRRYEKRHPALDQAPRIAQTATGIPGDPVNVGLIASEEQIHKAMLAAEWFPADPITLKSSIRIAGSTVLHRSYEDAPVSSLYLWGHKQDLAFEQPVGNDARKRHHVRFWRSEKLDEQGKPLWLGAATFDTKVGFSHTTGEITHHISSDVDGERDKVIADLQRVSALADAFWVDDFHPTLTGKNGGGDPYRTDGRLEVGVMGK